MTTIMRNSDETKSSIGLNKPKISGNSTPVTPGVYYPRNRLALHHQIQHRPKSTRIVRKTGDFNIERWNQKCCLLSTWFITLVEARWRWTLLHFFAAFTTNWLLFGAIHWVIALSHGDLIDDHLPYNQNSTQWTPCVKNIYGFTSTFLFSIEIHTTVAYGRRAITLECPQTIITMCLQCIVSSIFQAFMIGILFAKLTRPKARTKTILFCKKMAVCVRNEKLCLVFRVGDARTAKILNIKASVFVMRLEVNNHTLNNFEQIELNVEMDGCESTFFLWPISIIHVIDENSPLFQVSAADLLCGEIEILTVFEGLIESTGQPVQATTSYTAKDIVWGHRFLPIVTDDVTKHYYDVDFSKLSETVAVETPLCSASEYKSVINIFNVFDEDLDLDNHTNDSQNYT